MIFFIGCYRWLRPDIAPHASYSVMQFDIPTGYHVHKYDLLELRERNKLITRAYFADGKVVFYFEKVCLIIIGYFLV